MEKPSMFADQMPSGTRREDIVPDVQLPTPVPQFL
jgi:hypothetical protein